MVKKSELQQIPNQIQVSSSLPQGPVPVPEQFSFRHELIIRTIKIVDIFYITIITALMGFFTSYLIDKYCFPPWNIEVQMAKPNWQLFLEICMILGLIGTLAYVLRNLFQMIPFPLEGVEGFQHMRVHEVAAGGSIALFLFWFSNNLMNRIMLFKEKLSKDGLIPKTGSGSGSNANPSTSIFSSLNMQM